ncbi:MAG TPA: AMP-binding protein [Oscillospiraceae bacterium]|nr:AMP-binding protein [Oscillospiraceae bacterium]
MAIYEKFTGRTRESFSSLSDALENFKLDWEDDFNFAYDVVDVLGTEKPDKLAMLWISNEGEEKHFTFRDMMVLSNKAANFLTEMGVKKGDRVLLVLKRSYFFWVCLLALHKIGAIAIQATDMLKPIDYVYRCNKAEINYAIMTGEGPVTEYFDESYDEYKSMKKKFVTKHKDAGDSWINLEKGIEDASEQWSRPTGEKAIKAEDTMIMAFSSGTTGYPKIITHDHTYPLGHIMTGVFWHYVVDGGLHFTISDTGWLKALWGKIYGQWLGESAVMVYDFDKFDALDILKKLEQYKVTTFCVPPTMYRFMLLHDVESFNLSSLTQCCTAGEALSPEIYNEWEKATGLRIYEGFGQTETTLCISTLYPWMTPVPGSMGKPTPGYNVQILDEDGEIATKGAIGEVCIAANSINDRPRGLLTSYNRSEKDTLAAWHNGFYHTGDTAYMNEKGYFIYVGRNDDVIKSSGYRIGPFEIESVLIEHEAVLEAAVTGVPDPMRGFAVKATIVLRKGYEPSDELTKDIQNHVKNTTAPYKYPRIIEYVTELPKTFNGKVRRVEIRERDFEKTED